jgi:hypothetical protein
MKWLINKPNKKTEYVFFENRVAFLEKPRVWNLTFFFSTPLGTGIRGIKGSSIPSENPVTNFWILVTRNFGMPIKVHCKYTIYSKADYFHSLVSKTKY